MTGRIRVNRCLENPTVFGDTISNCIFTESCYLVLVSASIISKICFDCELAYKNWSSKVIVTGLVFLVLIQFGNLMNRSSRFMKL